MRTPPPRLLASSIPLSARRAAGPSAAAVSFRFTRLSWRTYSRWPRLAEGSPGHFHLVTQARSSSSSSCSSSSTPSSSEPESATTETATGSVPLGNSPSSSPSSTTETTNTETTATISSSSSLRPPRRPPFRFETGTALFAKRTPRPFPPPFLSPPSGSFSDPLSTHHRRHMRGRTNGDDAVFAGEQFVCANDGVGAWSTRPKGNASLWARLILHFWVAAMQEDATKPRIPGDCYVPDPVSYLQRAYERTIEATSPPNDWQGTTTACGAQLHYRKAPSPSNSAPSPHDLEPVSPLLYVTSLGDSQVMVIRPSDRTLVYKTTEQWHWFDCPRQLGTNSPDTPRVNAVVDEVPIMEGDVVLAMTDGVIDNLWAHEIVDNVSDSVARWEAGEGIISDIRFGADPHKLHNHGDSNEDGKEMGAGERARRKGGRGGGMEFVAEELMQAAKAVALDPFAQSPFMEHAIEEGLASEGGKLDDISVVAALCTRRER